MSAGSGGVYVIDVDPDALEVAASRWDRVADMLDEAAEEFSRNASAISPDEWSGFTRDAACAEMAGLGRELARFAPVVRRAPQALRRVADRAREALDTGLPALRRQRQDALDEYAARDRAARAQADRAAGETRADPLPGGQITGTPTAASAARDRAIDGAAADRDRDLRTLDRRFEDLTEDLREEFRRAGEAIAQATVAPAAPAARSAYAAGGLGALSGAVLDTASIAGKLRDDLPWAWAALEAARAGDLARETLGNHDHLTAADLTELRTVLNAHRDDRAFATLFLQSLGAQGLIDLNARMILSVPRAPQPDAEYTRLVAEVGALQGTLGDLLALATTDPGQSGQVSQFWITDLTRAGRERLGDQPPRSNLYGYHVLGPLLGQGTYSADFLSAVGGNIIAFEREHAHPPGSAFWTDAATSPLAPPRLDWTTPLPVPDYDPLTAVLSAAAKDPAAARAFLTADVQEYSEQEIGLLKLMPNSVGLRLNRLDYLLTDRVWAPYPGRTGTSGLDALGHLLTRATSIDPRNPDSRWIVESIAHEITIDEQATEHPFAATDLTAPALRPYLADVFAAHLGSMYENRPPEAGTDIPRLGHGESILLMAELGKDPDAYATLHRTIAAQTALLYDYYLHYPMTPDRVSPILESISLSAGELLGALDHGAALTDIERVTATDKSDPHATAAAFDLTTALLDQTLSKAGTAVGTAVGAASAGPPGAVAASTAVEALTMGAHALLDELEGDLAAPQDSTGTLDSIARTRFTNGADTLHGALEAAIIRTLPHDVRKQALVLDPDGNLLPKDQWEEPETAEKVINKHLETKDPRTGIKAVLDKTWNLYGQGRDNARNLQSRP